MYSEYTIAISISISRISCVTVTPIGTPSICAVSILMTECIIQLTLIVICEEHNVFVTNDTTMHIEEYIHSFCYSATITHDVQRKAVTC